MLALCCCFASFVLGCYIGLFAVLLVCGGCCLFVSAGVWIRGFIRLAAEAFGGFEFG